MKSTSAPFEQRRKCAAQPSSPLRSLSVSFPCVQLTEGVSSFAGHDSVAQFTPGGGSRLTSITSSGTPSVEMMGIKIGSPTSSGYFPCQLASSRGSHYSRARGEKASCLGEMSKDSTAAFGAESKQDNNRGAGEANVDLRGVA